MRFQFLSNSDRLTEIEKRLYFQLIDIGTEGKKFSDEVLRNGLLNLSILLHKYYGQKTILLIDEYDVPLDKAFAAGYYDEMADLVRNVFGQALKTNESLYFAVLTGCLRVSCSLPVI